MSIPLPHEHKNGVARSQPGIRIATSYIVAACKRRPLKAAAAMRWLANYARLMGLVEEDFCGQLGMTVLDVRNALIHPAPGPGVVEDFIESVGRVRKLWEQSLHDPKSPNPFPAGTPFHDGFRPLVETRVYREVRRAFKAAAERHMMAEVIGQTRLGKSAAAARFYLLNLDSTLWATCPSCSAERAFARELSMAAGMEGKTWSHPIHAVYGRVETVFGRGGYEVLIVDEGHYLWHRQKNTSPGRLEECRRIRDKGTGVMIVATPQFSSHLADAFSGDEKWAPGQYEGRVQTFRLPDTLSDADLAAVARYHAPDFSAELIDELVNFAKRSEGYCGGMVNLIQRARDAFEEFKDKPRLELLKRAEEKQEAGRRMQLIAQHKIVPMAARKARRAA